MIKDDIYILYSILRVLSTYVLHSSSQTILHAKLSLR